MPTSQVMHKKKLTQLFCLSRAIFLSQFYISKAMSPRKATNNLFCLFDCCVLVLLINHWWRKIRNRLPVWSLWIKIVSPPLDNSSSLFKLVSDLKRITLTFPSTPKIMSTNMLTGPATVTQDMDNGRKRIRFTDGHDAQPTASVLKNPQGQSPSSAAKTCSINAVASLHHGLRTHFLELAEKFILAF